MLFRSRIRSALRTARLTREQSLLHYQGVVADTLLEVRTAYYGVLLAEQQVLVQEAAVKSLSLGLENTRQRFNTGLVPRYDVLRAEVELANVQPRLIQATNAYRISKFTLANTLGYNIAGEDLEDLPLKLTDKLEARPYMVKLSAEMAQALQRRPELGAFRKAEGLRKEGIVAAKAGYKPSLDVFGGYSAHNSRYFDDIMRDVAGGIAGVELNWNIFDGKLTRGKVMEAKALHEGSLVDLADGIRRVQLEVRTAHSTFLQAAAVLESQSKVQEQAEEALRLSQSRYEAGTGTQLDVLTAQTALTQARTTQAQALHDFAVARARLEHAIGQDVPQTDPAANVK